MKREEFLKTAAFCGFCACAGMPAFAAEAVDDNPELKALQRKVAFVHLRFAKLVGMLEKDLPPAKLKKLLERLGRECSREFAPIYGKFKGNLEGFLAMCRKDWKLNCVHDTAAKKVVTYGEKTGECFCPFVDKARMTPAFCNCSLGWQKETFGVVIDKPVRVEILSAVLRGGRSCDFAVYYG